MLSGCQSPSFRGTNPIRTAAAGPPDGGRAALARPSSTSRSDDERRPQSSLASPPLGQSDARDLLHRFAEFRFQTVVESITDYAVFMLDPYGNVATWNAGPRASRAIAPRRSSATTSRFYPPDAIAAGRPSLGPPRRPPMATSRTKAGACARTARSSGRT